jgi:hypothetical protein
MPDILRISSITVLLTVGLAAYFLVVGALFPQRIEKIKSMVRSMPGRSFGIGLVNFVFFAALALALFSLAENARALTRGILTVPAILITAFLAVMLSFGFAALTNIIGGHFLPDAIPWKQTLWGSVCLSFACVLPFLGWFLLLPYTGFLGVGAFILGLFQRDPKP